MKSRLFNELRAAELFGGWLKTTSELEVKAMMARSAHEEVVHAGLLSTRIRELGADPFVYHPLPAQRSMFNALEGISGTCERLAGVSMAGEGVANHLIKKCLAAPSVPDWIKAPYKRIRADEEGHGSGPQEILELHATSPERQDATRRACGHAFSVVTGVSRKPEPMGFRRSGLVTTGQGLSKTTFLLDVNVDGPRHVMVDATIRLRDIKTS